MLKGKLTPQTNLPFSLADAVYFFSWHQLFLFSSGLEEEEEDAVRGTIDENSYKP